MTAVFKQGDTVYSDFGQQAQYVAKSGDGHIVLPLVEAYSGDGEESYDHVCDPTQWRAVFTEPPVVKYSDELKALHGKLDAAREQLRAVQTEIATAQRDNGDLLTRLKKMEPLRYIEDFLDNKITHYAHLDDYGNAKIIPIEQATCSTDRFTPRLLALYGDRKNRTVSWLLHQYSDASGAPTSGQWMPARSEDEARELIKDFIAKRLARGDAHQMSYLTSFVRAANKWGVEVKPEFQAKADAETTAGEQRAMEYAMKELEKAQQRVAELKAISKEA